jgi:hypothetical protein
MILSIKGGWLLATSGWLASRSNENPLFTHEFFMGILG